MGTIFQVNESNGAVNITGAVTLNSNQIHLVSDPTSAQDAATKNYVDTLANGITWKQAVQAATVASLPSNTYSNGSSGVGATLTATANAALIIDGYTVTTNDRVLIQTEASASHNGIYVVTQTGSGSTPYILTRSADYNTPSEVQAGTAVFAVQGTINADRGFVQITTGTITIGTTALSFTQFTSLAGNATYREDYVVGTPSGNYTGSLTVFNLLNAYIVGSNTLIVILDGDVQTRGASIDYIETNSTTVTFDNTLIAGQKVSFLFSAPISASPSGVVNAGNTNQLAYYATSSTTVSGLTAITASSALASDTNGLPVASSTTSTELGYVHGVTSAIQTQLNGKAPTANPTFTGTVTAPVIDITNTTNQLTLGTTNTVTISSTAPSANRTYTLPDAGAAANIVLDAGNYTIGGTWSFNNNITLASSKALILTDNTTNTVSVKATNSTTSYTLSLPTTAGTANYFLQTDGSGNTSWQPGGSGTVSSGTQYQLAYYATSSSTISGDSNITTNASNQLLATDGTVSLPGYSFSTDTDLGIYRNGTDQMGFVGNGASMMQLQPIEIDFYINGSVKAAISAANISSNLPFVMNSNKITSLANGTAASDAAAFGQIFYGGQKAVQTTTSTSTSVTSATFTACTNASVTITPTSASNRIKITVSGRMYMATGGTIGYATIKRGSTELSGVADGFWQGYVGAAAGVDMMQTASFSFIDSPGTTSATTYQVFIRSDGTHTITFGEASGLSVVIAEEIV